MSYRRARDQRDWHWFTNCPRWPSENFAAAPLKPTEGEMCTHCHRLETEGTGMGSLSAHKNDKQLRPEA
jgi:hypothetical protein